VSKEEKEQGRARDGEEEKKEEKLKTALIKTSKVKKVTLSLCLTN
jgi:hypothetical protein